MLVASQHAEFLQFGNGALRFAPLDRKLGRLRRAFRDGLATRGGRVQLPEKPVVVRHVFLEFVIPALRDFLRKLLEERRSGFCGRCSASRASIGIGFQSKRSM